MYLNRQPSSKTFVLHKQQQIIDIARVFENITKNSAKCTFTGEEADERINVMNEKVEKGRPGKYFDDYLKEKGTYESTTLQALVELLIESIDESIKCSEVDKNEIAKLLQSLLVKLGPQYRIGQ